MAAGTLTVTSARRGGLTRYSLAWTSDASGDVNGNPFDMQTGELRQVQFTPDSGLTQPSAAYDVVLNDPNSVDILAGAGANLSSTTTSVAVPVVSTYFRRTLEAGAYTPVVTNAGNAKTGTIVLLVQPL